jgi:hypothetical protein
MRPKRWFFKRSKGSKKCSKKHKFSLITLLIIIFSKLYAELDIIQATVEEFLR